MGKVQYQKTFCILIIHPVLLSLTTVTMDTRETGHKARDISILRDHTADRHIRSHPPITITTIITMTTSSISVSAVTSTFLHASRPSTTSSTTGRTVTCQNSTPRSSTPDAPLLSPAPSPPGNTGRTQRVPPQWWSTTPTRSLPPALVLSMGILFLLTGTLFIPPWRVNDLFSPCRLSPGRPKSDPRKHGTQLNLLNSVVVSFLL